MIPDACEIHGPLDCDANGAIDACDIALLPALDCDTNSILDDCESGGEDCDTDGVTDRCDAEFADCNSNGHADACDITRATSLDCDTNGAPDACDIAAMYAASLIPANLTDFALLGAGVAVCGDTVVVGAYGQGNSPNDCGAAYVFEYDGTDWNELTQLAADDLGPGDGFGYSVAIDGDTILVGAPFHRQAGVRTGATYVFRRMGGVWQQIARIIASDGTINDRFGSMVSLSGDTAVVTAATDNTQSLRFGSVYVFREVGGMWQQETKLVPDATETYSEFGRSHAVQGDTLLVGCGRFPSTGDVFPNSGVVFVFQRTGSVWQPTSVLTAGAPQNFALFGVSVSFDGQTALIGAAGEVGDDFNDGAAYVFRAEGGSWNQIARIKPDVGEALIQFGRSVAVSGKMAAIGAIEYPLNHSPSGSGLVHVYREVDGVWQRRATIRSSDVGADPSFGGFSAMDGFTAVFGVPFSNLPDADEPGSAHVVALPGANDCNANNIPDVCEPGCSSCPGDLSGDGLVDGDDVAAFVACVFGDIPCPCSDIDGDGMDATCDADDDFAAFVALLISPGNTACP